MFFYYYFHHGKKVISTIIENEKPQNVVKQTYKQENGDEKTSELMIVKRKVKDYLGFQGLRTS